MPLLRELLERAKRAKEGVDWLIFMLVTLTCVALAAQQFIENPIARQISEKAAERLHTFSFAIDLVVVALVAATVLIRLLFMNKDNKPWTPVFADKVLSKQLEGLFRNQTSLPIQATVRFCSSEEIDELSEMNYEAFKTGDFAIEREKLLRRNRAYHRRNDRIFMFIENPLIPKQHIGYSAMVPLTEEGLEHYLNGGLRDADIPPSLVASDRSSTAGVLLFAIHLAPEYSFTKSAASKDFALYFLACVRLHAWSLFSPDGPTSGDYPPIYMQTSEGSLRRRVHEKWNFEIEPGRVSANGFPILVLKEPFGRVAS